MIKETFEIVGLDGKSVEWLTLEVTPNVFQSITREKYDELEAAKENGTIS
jgi:hypothetical protein